MRKPARPPAPPIRLDDDKLVRTRGGHQVGSIGSVKADFDLVPPSSTGR